MSIHNIPLDLLPKIFEKLPLKTLCQLRSVCREWNTFIGSSYFISHLRDVTASNPYLHSMMMIPVYEGVCCLYTSPRNPYHIKDFMFPSTHPSKPIISVVGLIHGVMCISFVNQTTKNTTLAMWNPSIHRVIVAPSIRDPLYSNGNYMVGFGFNPITNDLKIVAVPYCCMNCTTGPCTPTAAFVFSAKEWGWRVVENNVLPCTTRFGELNAPYLNRSIHWARSTISGQRAVLVFNCETEEFGTIALPERYAGLDGTDQFTEREAVGKIDLQLFRGKLAVYEYELQQLPLHKTCKITVMKEYGVADSWSHLFTIVLYVTSRVLMAREEDGDEIIFTSRGLLFAYNTRCNGFRPLRIFFHCESTNFELFSFEPSFLLMDAEGSVPYRRGNMITI